MNVLRRPCIHVALLAVCCAPPLIAATIQVDATADEDSAIADNGNCTLREAILSANTNLAVDNCTAGDAGPGVVDHILVPAETYLLTLSGSDNSGEVGDLDLTDDVILEGDNARTTIIDAGDLDRVVDVPSGVVAQLINLTLQNGNAGGNGGGVENGGTLTVDRCLVFSNHADGPGGGIRNDGTLTVVDSTLQENSTNDHGGGIDGHGSETLLNVTVTGNSVSGGGAGGGLYNLGGTTMSLSFVTVTGNSAGSGAALHVGGTFIVGDSLIHGPCDGSVTTQGGNVESPGSTCGFGGSDLENVADPQLLTLADNGGPTPTHALAATSSAVDAALNANCPAADQRGVTRPLDGDGDTTATCDAGAYELQPLAADLIFQDNFETGDTTAWDG